MAAPKGNDYGTKLKNPTVRQEAYRQYCDWIASGYPRESFFFDHPEHSVCWETIEKYMKDFPEEFPPILMKQARARRYQYWFEKGKNLTAGRQEDIPKDNRCNPSPQAWQVIMRNMFKKECGWDAEGANVVNITTSADEILNRITKSTPIVIEEKEDNDDS